MQWYYIQNGKRCGPVDETGMTRLVQGGTIKPTDLVWNETCGDQWAEARTFAPLFDGVDQPPPALPEPAPAGAATVRPSVGAPLSDPAAAPSGEISCTGPVGPAWERMKTLLFRPFDMGKWFVMGFSAFLAELGRGGVSFSLPDLNGLGQKGRHAAMDPTMLLEKARMFWVAHALVLVPVLIVAAVVAVVVSIVVLWVSCRGRFMFLDNVVNDRAEVARPWKVFVSQGNSLFLWLLCYGLAWLALGLVVGGAAVWGVVLPCLRAKTFIVSTVPVIVVLGVVLLAFGLVGAYISLFLDHFVVPIMHRHRVRVMEGWSMFLQVFRQQPGRFLVYGLFYLALSLLAGVAVLALVIATCCTACCVLVLPYLGSVALLPVSVFFRLYSVGYLAQFGAEYTVQPDPA